MKKFLIAIFFMILLLCGANGKNNFSLQDYFDGEYYVYTQNQIDNSSEDLGFCYMTKSIDTKAKIGESVVVENLEIGKALKDLKAEIIKSECLPDGTTVLYAYTDLISKNVEIEKQKVNLQIALKSNVTIIGWPLIIGSF